MFEPPILLQFTASKKWIICKHTFYYFLGNKKYPEIYILLCNHIFGVLLPCFLVGTFYTVQFNPVSDVLVSLISTTDSGLLLLLLLRSPTSPAAVYCIMGSYYVMSPPRCAGRHAVLIVKTIAFLAA